MTEEAAKQANRHWPSVAISSAVVFVILLVTIFLSPTRFDKESYLSICVDKQRLLHDTPSPRVVLIGGSNLATGLDSVLLESRLKRKIVNMGTCIQVGLGYMLREVEPEIKRGDVVVVIPEYEHWIDQFNGTKYLLMLPALLPDSIGWIVPSYLRPSSSITAALGDLASVAQKRARHFVPISLPSKDPDEGSTIYKRAGFNERGDFVGHLDLPCKINSIGPFSLPGISHPNLEALSEFNRSAARMKSRGARVILLPPVTTASFAKRQKPQLDKFYKTITERLKAEVVPSYDRYSLPDQLFFDSHYHVRRQGRQIRTEQVAVDLQQILQN